MILVTGATGNIGKELVAQLLAGKGQPLRVVSRDERKLLNLDPDVERLIGDLRERSTVERAVRGVDRLFLVWSLVDESHEADRMLIDEAQRAGVRHVVAISSLATSLAADRGIGALHREKERFIESSGMSWTFLRPGAFMSNALQWIGTIKSQGKVFSPTGDGQTAPISPYDIAAVAAVALTAPGHEFQIYELTGSELLSAHEQVKILARVLGKPIECVDVPSSIAAEGMRKAGLPAFVVDSLAEFWEDARRGGRVIKTDTVKRLTGREPQNFETWCREHRATFA
jgi:(4-alkanoyl-5-oxo-2,5-dihydrofuran-3-yl)methyl phosphate reductase